MNINKMDLNLLVYLDVLLREKNVTRAASRLNITQPAMSNGLKRLRDLLNDPILVRTSDGMVPTERARELAPIVRGVLLTLEETLQPNKDFEPLNSQRVFRIMASDYAASTLIPALLKKMRVQAPHTSLDIMTPSDVTFHDVENGKVDMAINRFDQLPQSFHQKTIWRDSFACLVNSLNPILGNFNLDIGNNNNITYNLSIQGLGTINGSYNEKQGHKYTISENNKKQDMENAWSSTMAKGIKIPDFIAKFGIEKAKDEINPKNFEEIKSMSKEEIEKMKTRFVIRQELH